MSVSPEYHANWRARNAEKVKLYGAKSRRKLKKKRVRDAKKSNLKRYSLTLAQYESLCAKQNNLCAICNGPPTAHGYLVVDHCHMTGKICKLLCSLCNTAIALLQEDPYIAQRAADYLLEHK